MPSRWFVPVVGIDPRMVQISHVHAAVSRWFDHTKAEHDAQDKPYTVSPMLDQDGEVGIVVTTLDGLADERLLAAINASRPIRLGAHRGTAWSPRILSGETWTELAEYSGARRWRWDLETPATWRAGNRSTPLPQPASILARLTRAWSLWSDNEVGDPPFAPWVSDLDLKSTLLTLPIQHRDQHRATVTVSAVTGSIVWRSSGDPQSVDPFLRLAAYTGVGSMTRRGLGAVAVTLGRS